ncbi:MAG: sulfatase-like hydrolase/transferase [Planctomycetes bacterium]|nr:sulfatase-like hydrolase/transferase [Planctomycetota bacterium]
MADERAPNVVFVFSDQQRADTLGCYGQELEVTPNLDRMAAEGVRFANAFTPQPVCGPARAVLQTGRYATEIGCFRNGIRLPAGERTIAHDMAEAGYDLAYLGKWHLASTHGRLRGTDLPVENYRTIAVPLDRRGGWNQYWLASDTLESTSHSYDGYMHDADGNRREIAGYRADWQTDRALEYLRTRPGGDRPFFLFISYIEPHHQNDHKHFEGPHGSKERFADFVVPGDLADTEGDWREEFADYLGCCASLDANLGRLRDELQRLGLADNTLVIYTSDHGCHFRTRNREYKRSCHDAAIRIPLIACGPGFRGGQVVEELVSLIDLPPTILAAGGVPTPQRMRGRPLQPLVDGTASDWGDDVFVQISESHVGRAIRTARWTYSVRAAEASGNEDPDSPFYVEDFLYDNDADADQRNNLVADPALVFIRADLAARLTRRMIEAGEIPPVIRPAEA